MNPLVIEQIVLAILSLAAQILSNSDILTVLTTSKTLTPEQRDAITKLRANEMQAILDLLTKPKDPGAK